MAGIHALCRLTIRGTLLSIALIGVTMGAFRWHISIGSFVAGVLALTIVRTREVIGGFRRQGLPMGADAMWTLAFSSLAVSLVIVGTSVLVSLWVFSVTLDENYFDSPSPRNSSCVGPAFLGILAGSCVCAAWRKAVWPYRYPEPPSATAETDEAPRARL
jgi:hypothetical protein